MKVSTLHFRLCRTLWACALVLLPISSLPWLAKISSAVSVAPPSVLFLLVLAVVWLLPNWLRGGWLPFEVKPYLLWVIVGVVSWLAAFFIAIPPFHGRSILSEGVETWVTLLMGLATYLTTSAWLSARPENLPTALRWINLGGIVMLAWALVQAFYVIFFHSQFPAALFRIQSMISSSPNTLYVGRVTGLAFEPSWLGHQLCLVYLPLWLSATLSGCSAHRKLGRISVENVLLVLGVGVLYFSFARMSWVSFLLVLVFIAVRLNVWLARRMQARLFRRVSSRPTLQRVTHTGLLLFLVLAILTVYVALGWGLFRLGTRFEPRLARILENNPLKSVSFYDFAARLYIAERVVYWNVGFEIFGDHPLLGVGLGNAGFYFRQYIPAFGFRLLEINDGVNRWAYFPNVKSLWVRVLAETGLVGFAFFLSWYYLLWRAAVSGRGSTNLQLSRLGWAGTFILIAFLVEGFSVDSLALPYIWFSLGIVSAVGFQARRASRLAEDPRALAGASGSNTIIPEAHDDSHNGYGAQV
jgi:hypothetical protein